MYINKRGEKIRTIKDVTGSLYKPTKAYGLEARLNSPHGMSIKDIYPIGVLSSDDIPNMDGEFEITFVLSENIKSAVLLSLYEGIYNEPLLAGEEDIEELFYDRILRLKDSLSDCEDIANSKPDLTSCTKPCFIVITKKGEYPPYAVFSGIPADLFARYIPFKITYTCAVCGAYTVGGESAELNFYYNADTGAHLCPEHQHAMHGNAYKIGTNNGT